MPVHQTAIPASSGVLSTVTDTGVTKTPTALYGWIGESAAASAFEIYDGASTAGKKLTAVHLGTAVDEDVELPVPLEVSSGSLYINILSGTPTGFVLWA